MIVISTSRHVAWPRGLGVRCCTTRTPDVRSKCVRVIKSPGLLSLRGSLDANVRPARHAEKNDPKFCLERTYILRRQFPSPVVVVPRHCISLGL
jgi:hypothetical protein